jgi:hypothetical protein
MSAMRTHTKFLRIRARTPDEWSASVRTIPCPRIRGAVACIIWWDWFGPRICSHAWPQLDDLVETGNAADATPDELRTALIAIGYSADIAAARTIKRGLKGRSIPRPAGTYTSQVYTRRIK